jgi:hypothetical protein
MLNEHIKMSLWYQPRLQFLAGAIALLLDQERLDERRGGKRDAPCVAVSRADAIEKWRRLRQ